MDLNSLPGSILDDKYQLDRQLGKGGMGTVFLATHLGTTRTVAIKVISPHLAGHDEFFLRFQREAEAAGRMRHPNVVNVTDFGVTTVSNGELAYLVMEYLDGQTLSEYQNEHQRAPLPTVLDIVDQVALALEAAHAAGIVHRDLKPDNVWLESNRRGGYNVKVLDFGIAKLSDPVGAVRTRTVPSVAAEATSAPLLSAESPEAGETLAMPQAAVELTRRRSSVSVEASTIDPVTLQTTVGSVMGTPTYMAPEQWQGPTIDHRADIYSLAVIAYQLLCGRLPFQGRTPTQLLDMHLHARPESLHNLDPSIPPALSRVVLAGLEKDPDRRPQTATTFAALLRSNAEGELTVLRKSKDLMHVRVQFLLPLLLISVICILPFLAALRYAARAMVDVKVPLLAVMAVVDVCTFLLLLFYLRLYKASCAIGVNHAIESGQFRSSAGLVAATIARRGGSFLRTHFTAMFDFRPSSFACTTIWPVVWALENKSGDAVVRRCRELASNLPGGFRGLAIREYSVAFICVFMFSSVMSLFGGSPTDVIRVLTAPGGISWFMMIYPLFFTMIYLGFGPAFLFLYWSALRCRNEGVEPALPEGGVKVSKKRAALLRPGTLFWASMPIIMTLVMIFVPLTTWHGTAFQDASEDGRAAALLRSVASGTPVDQKDARGWTPLMQAVATGQSALVQQLIARGANINAQNRVRNTPLILAAIHNRTEIAGLLLDHGAAVDAANEDGRTALMVAAMRGEESLLTLLLQHGANRRKADSQEKTAVDYAREEGHAGAVALLAP